MIVLGLTDVWSAIRNATVSRLSRVIQHFTLDNLEIFFSKLYSVCVLDETSHLFSWYIIVFNDFAR